MRDKISLNELDDILLDYIHSGGKESISAYIIDKIRELFEDVSDVQHIAYNMPIESDESKIERIQGILDKYER